MVYISFLAVTLSSLFLSSANAKTAPSRLEKRCTTNLDPTYGFNIRQPGGADAGGFSLSQAGWNLNTYANDIYIDVTVADRSLATAGWWVATDATGSYISNQASANATACVQGTSPLSTGACAAEASYVNITCDTCVFYGGATQCTIQFQNTGLCAAIDTSYSPAPLTMVACDSSVSGQLWDFDLFD